MYKRKKESEYCLHQRSSIWLLQHTADSLLFWSLLAAALIAVSLLCGPASLTWAQIMEALHTPGSSAHTILFQVRLPRIAGALICGPALATAGYILQNVLHNPLAAPSSAGLQSGAGFAAVLASVLFPSLTGIRMPAAFLGCICSSALLLLLCGRNRVSRSTLILAGLAISQIFSAGIDLVVTLQPDVLAGYSSFKIGSLAGISLQKLIWPGILSAAGLAAAFSTGKELEVLSLGADSAQSLGLHAARWTRILLGIACLLSACVVSLAGLIGFIGLMVPNLVRKTVSGSCTRQIAGCVVQGAAMLLLCDLLARTVFQPFELPTGIVLSLLGGPYFLWLLIGLRRHR